MDDPRDEPDATGDEGFEDDDSLDGEQFERIFASVRHLRYETGPVALSVEYLKMIAEVESAPESQSGVDKSWVSRAQREFREHYARARRVR